MKRLDSLLQAPSSTLQCRGMGHSWEHANDTDLSWFVDQLRSLYRWERCYRCGAQRVRELDLARSVIGRARMVYGDDYLMVRGVHVDRISALAELYRRELLALHRRQQPAEGIDP